MCYVLSLRGTFYQNVRELHYKRSATQPQPKTSKKRRMKH